MFPRPGLHYLPSRREREPNMKKLSCVMRKTLRHVIKLGVLRWSEAHKTKHTPRKNAGWKTRWLFRSCSSWRDRTTSSRGVGFSAKICWLFESCTAKVSKASWRLKVDGWNYVEFNFETSILWTYLSIKIIKNMYTIWTLR